MDLHELGVRELGTLLRKRKLSVMELTEHFLDRIARLDPILNAYLSLRPNARRDAARADRTLRSGGPVPPLCGIPVALKDLVLGRDHPATAGSRAFGDGVTSDHDAPVIRHLQRSGAVILGRVTLHEIALGVTTVNEHFGPVRNPWNVAHVAGGSSGGSAVAVAAGLATLAVGTDTRGSIRIPAACCGIAGLKPTFGLVSTRDVLPLSPTLDHVGPMARTARDTALMLGAMTGKSAPAEQWEAATTRRARGIRVGVSPYHLRDLDAAVQKPLDEFLRTLRRLGANLREVAIPGAELAHRDSIVITGSEALAYHQRTLEATPEAFGPRVRERLAAGAKWSAVQYLTALETRRRFEQEMHQLFATVDVIVGATLPVLPPLISDQAARIDGREVPLVDAMSRLTAPQNMARVPALAIPAGFAPNGLPVSAQVIAGQGREDLVFRLACAYERETEWWLRQPRLNGS